MGEQKSDITLPLAGKICLVTGATSGIGLAAARALAARGAGVIGIGRDPARAERARDVVASSAADPKMMIRYDILDLSDLRAVDVYARGIAAGRPAAGGEAGGSAERSPRLDAIVNCAGFYVDRRVFSADGYEMQFAVNHLAHFWLTTRLIPLLSKSPDARVVTVSSGSHYYGRIHWASLERSLRGEPPRFPYIGIRAYEQSKLACALFTAGLARRAGYPPLTAFTADPGLVNTEMGLKQGASLGSFVWNIRRRYGTSPEVPAEAIAWLVSEPSLAGKTGLYWKDKAAVAPSRLARDIGDAERLWALSEAFVASALEGRRK